MRWVDDWPLIGEDVNRDGIGEPVRVWKKANVGAAYPIAIPQASDDFADRRLGRQWQCQANPREAWYSLEKRPNHLRLYEAALPEGASTLYDAPISPRFPLIKSKVL